MKLSHKTLLIIILLGVIFIAMNSEPKAYNEHFTGATKCPDVLVQKGKKLHLYNSKLAKIPGVNPLVFNNLEDYVEYLKWQRHENISCPVLFLQHSYDAQNNSVYKQRPSPLDLHGGLPSIIPLSPQNQFTKLLDATRNDPPYNKNSYPGFDPNNQYIGLKTPLDKIYHQSFDGKSPNPMDSNWGGTKLTQKLIDKGYYKDNNVKIKIPD